MKLSTKKMPSGEYQVYLGAVRIADVAFVGKHVELRPPGSFTPHIYDTMTAAIDDLLRFLNSPPPENAKIVRLRRVDGGEFLTKSDPEMEKLEPEPKKKKTKSKSRRLPAVSVT